MARIIIGTTSSDPVGRLEVLTGLFGGVGVMPMSGVGLRERAAENLREAVAIGNSGGNTVVGVIVPQNCLGDIGVGDAAGDGVAILTEEFVRRDGRVLVVGQDATGRDRFQVAGYRRLVQAELRLEPAPPADCLLDALVCRVLVVSRHAPKGRQEIINAAFGRQMELVVEDVPFDGRPRDAIAGTIARIGKEGGVDAVVVPKSILNTLRFGDAFGRDVPILIEEMDRTADGAHTSAGQENGGRDVFRVTGLLRFIRAEVITEPVVKSVSA